MPFFEAALRNGNYVGIRFEWRENSHTEPMVGLFIAHL